MQYNSQQVQFVPVPNQQIPDEGPKAIPLLLDFSTDPNGTIDIDGQMIGAQGRFAMVQTIFIDLNGAANPLTVTFNQSGQSITAKVNTQGYYNVLAPNPWKIRFQSLPGSTDNVGVYLINVPIPGVVWPTV